MVWIWTKSATRVKNINKRKRLHPTFRFFKLAISLGWQDVGNTYARSTLGPWWVTIALGIQVASIGLVFGLVLRAEMAVYLPYLAISLTLWGFLLSSLTDATSAYIQSEPIIKQIYVPSFFPILRVLTKNLIIFAHNLSIVVIVMAVFGMNPEGAILLFVPGLLVMVAVIYAVSVILATVSTRFRDVPPIISAFLLLSFYLTPIIWMPDSLPEEVRNIVLTWNPINHLLELMRSPIMGSAPTALNWGAGLGTLVAVGLFAWWCSKKYSWKIVYWL